MPLTLAGKNIALLASNGFDENQMTEIQRALTKAKAHIKIIAPEQGLVNGWQGDSWGHHFHVDIPIGEALGSDFDMLVLPGGARGTGKLKQNLHTRRIINHFMEANKPVTAIGAGVELLALGDKISGRTIAAALESHDVLKSAGAVISEKNQETFGNLLTANGDDVGAWVEGTLEFFAEAELVMHAA